MWGDGGGGGWEGGLNQCKADRAPTVNIVIDFIKKKIKKRLAYWH